MAAKRSVQSDRGVNVRKSSSGRSSRRTTIKNESEIFVDSGHVARRGPKNEADSPSPPRTDYRIENVRAVNFGGEVTVVGRFSRNEKAELIALAGNLGANRHAKDPEDRILRLKSSRDGFVLQTSKGNLAVAIGKHLHRARKGGSLTIIWSRHDLPVWVIWSPAVEEQGQK